MRAAVARGAALLDEVKPGWALAVDPDTLNLADCTLCVLGQLYGIDERLLTGYSIGLSSLCPEQECRAREEWARQHGFSCYGNGWDQAEALWREEIAERRAS